MRTPGLTTYRQLVSEAPFFSATSLPSNQPAGLPVTVRELRASGHVQRSVKAELRENMLDLMRAGKPRFPGVVGFDDTVLPDLERALLAGHDLVLLGERGQGKTRLIRTIVGLLDEWRAARPRAGQHEHPAAPHPPPAPPRAPTGPSGSPRSWPLRTPASVT